MDFAARLAALMAERGMSTTDVARLVPCDRGYVSKLANGAKRPSPHMAGRLDQVLDAGGQLAAAATLWRPDGLNGGFTPDDEDRLIQAVRRPSRIDTKAIDSLAAVLAAQRQLEDRIGSAPMLAPVAAQLAAAEHLITDAPARLRARVLDVTAQYGYFRGWLHENTGQLREAVELYDRALGQAAEAGDTNLVSELLSMKGHVAWARGDPDEVVRLSQAAQRDRSAYPGQHAISAMQEARALAALGDARAVSRKLADAERSGATADEHQDDRPPWLYYHSPGFFTVQRGRAWLHLSAHDPRHIPEAIKELTAGVAALDETARASEWGATYLLYLARAWMLSGDAEQAVAAAGQVAAIAARLASSSLIARVRALHSRLAERWPGDPAIAGLTDALR